MKKRFKVSIALLSFVALTTPSLAQFSDVDASTEYQTAINWTVEEGITNGYGDGRWGPDICVLRAELLKMLTEYRFANEGGFDAVKDDLDLLRYPSFSDVESADWFYDYARYAETSGIMQGYEDGTLRPLECVNRVEAIKMAVEALAPEEKISGSAPLYYDDKSIADMSATTWYSPHARFLFEHRLVGSSHTRFVDMPADYEGPRLINFFPAEDMSRKEVAHMLYQMDGYLMPQTNQNVKLKTYEWDKYKTSFQIPEEINVHDNLGKNILYLDPDDSLSEDDSLIDIAYLEYIEDGDIETLVEDYAIDKGYVYYSGRRFRVVDTAVSIESGRRYRDFLLEVEGGVLRFHKGTYYDPEEIEDRVLHSLLTPNASLQIVEEVPTASDYLTMGNDVTGEDIELIGDLLNIELSFPGYCTDHDFNLYWDGLFEGDEVIHADLQLVHDNNEDTCTHSSRDEQTFDIGSLLSAFRSTSKDKLNIRVYSGGQLRTVNYER